MQGASNEDKYAHILPAGASAQGEADSSLQLDGSQGEGDMPKYHSSTVVQQRKNISCCALDRDKSHEEKPQKKNTFMPH